MSNQIFNFNSNPVRVELFNNQPYFCLLDVCGIFEIQNSRRVQRQMLDPQGVRLAYTLAKDEKQRKTAFINEPNLYRIIFRSEKPVAKEFQNWVFEEVLPQIRKTGRYQHTTPVKQYYIHFTEEELKELAWLWRSALRMVKFSQDLVKPLNLLNSSLAGQAFGQATEYHSQLKRTQPIIQRITQDFEIGHWSDESWNRVLPLIRNNI